MNKKKQTIGLIGVGMMGSGIAMNVLRKGYPLVVLEHPGNQPLDALLAAGAETSVEGSDMASRVDILILCLTGTPEVEHVLFKTGVLDSLAKGSTVIDCSTAIPSSTLRIAEALQDAGIHFLDAPMTRTPKEAAEGRLNLIVGGDRRVYDDCLDVLQSFAENIVYAGASGSGHRMKLLHNYVSLGFAAVLSEAAACASQSGTDAHMFCEVLAAGGGSGTILNRLRPYIESADSSGFQFAMSNALKDMNYYCAMVDAQNVPADLAAAIRALYDDATKAGLDDAPVPELMSYLTKDPIHDEHNTRNLNKSNA